jgi:hypothetical protein
MQGESMQLFEFEKKKTYKIYCDVDGVLADFHQRATQLTGMNVLPDNNDREETKLFWAKLKQHHPQVFRDLPLMSDGKKLWQYIRGYNPTMLTAVPRVENFPTAPDDKKHWIQQHFGPTIPVIVVPSAKVKQQYAEPNAVLIDDRADTIEQWNAKGGIGIVHKNAKTTIQQLQRIGL